MSFTDEIFQFDILLFTACPEILCTRLIAALVAITHNVFLARSPRAGNSNLWSRHHWRMLLYPCTKSSI